MKWSIFFLLFLIKIITLRKIRRYYVETKGENDRRHHHLVKTEEKNGRVQNNQVKAAKKYHERDKGEHISKIQYCR